MQTTAIFISPGLAKFVEQTIEQTIHNPKIVIVSINSTITIY